MYFKIRIYLKSMECDFNKPIENTFIDGLGTYVLFKMTDLK